MVPAGRETVRALFEEAQNEVDGVTGDWQQGDVVEVWARKALLGRKPQPAAVVENTRFGSLPVLAKEGRVAVEALCCLSAENRGRYSDTVLPRRE